jgi:hypothetical protein
MPSPLCTATQGAVGLDCGLPLRFGSVLVGKTGQPQIKLSQRRTPISAAVFME